MSCSNLKKVAEFESPEEEANYKGGVKKYTAAQRAMAQNMLSFNKNNWYKAITLLESIDCGLKFSGDHLMNFEWFLITKYPSVYQKWTTVASVKEIVDEIFRNAQKYLHKITYSKKDVVYTGLGRHNFPSKKFRDEVLSKKRASVRKSAKESGRKSAKSAKSTASAKTSGRKSAKSTTSAKKAQICELLNGFCD